MVFWYQVFNVFDYKVYQCIFGGGKLVVYVCQDYMLDLSFCYYFFQGMGKVGDNDDCCCVVVVELMFQFVWGI